MVHNLWTTLACLVPLCQNLTLALTIAIALALALTRITWFRCARSSISASRFIEREICEEECGVLVRVRVGAQANGVSAVAFCFTSGHTSPNSFDSSDSSPSSPLSFDSFEPGFGTVPSFESRVGVRVGCG